ncbi:DUF1648 domain-containing protein [Cryobacterium sinapicolor]|uniref:DUF1648 domain-containing protein n=1 Tax=Cryobacterium sinapicolor TaxID=1259236 RepID=A0ABY2IW39_9MICO|nr:MULTISPECIES: DUF5808 domain-containing protein [Cryobacterium]TFC93972.1 DUF1648 domain-containing protein [Cryobacterium sinapicolor]
MTDIPSSDLSLGDGFPPATAALLTDYFDRLRGAAREARIDIDRDSLDELVAHVRDRLEGSDRSLEAVHRVLAELGKPEALARAYEADASDDDFGGDERSLTGLFKEPRPRRTGAGTFLGFPYDIRPPTSERFASRAWNPADRRMLVPKALGIGWTLNFGALAVRAHLVRPDDEDVPFAEVPLRVVAATMLVPIALLTAFAVVAAATWAGLPPVVPSHWGVFGKPDGYSDRDAHLVLLSGLAAVPVAAAGWVHLARRSRWNRVSASAVSLALATVALTILVQTVYSVRVGAGIWPTWVGICCAVALPLALLVGVSRSGRAAEQRRDFAAKSKKGTTK